MRTLVHIAAVTAIAVAAFAAPATLHAQAPSNGEQPPITQASRTTAPPVIDGRLDDDVWSTLDPLSGFTQRAPSEGRPVSQATEVRILQDDAALYIGAWFFDEDPEGIVVGQTPAPHTAKERIHHGPQTRTPSE